MRALLLRLFGAFLILLNATHHATCEMVDLPPYRARVFGTLRANSCFDKTNKHRNFSSFNFLGCTADSASATQREQHTALLLNFSLWRKPEHETRHGHHQTVQAR